MADSDILRGARLAAAARELGMSENELFEYIGKRTQSANRRSGINRSQEQGVEQFLSKFDTSQQAVSGIPREISGKRSISNEIIESGEFGNQDALQNFGGVDSQGRTANVELAADERGRASSRRDPNVFSKREMVKNADGSRRRRERQIILDANQPLRDEDIIEQEKLRDFGLRIDTDNDGQGGYIRRGATVNQRLVGPLLEGQSRPAVRMGDDGKRLYREAGQEVANPSYIDRGDRIIQIKQTSAPNSVLLDAASRAQALIDAGGAPSGAEDIVTRLQDTVYGNPEAEQALVRDMMRKDRDGLNDEEVANAVRLEFSKRFEDTKRPSGVTDADVKNALEAEIRARRVSPEAASERLLVNKLLEERAIRNASGGSGDALDRIGTIGKLGHAKYATDFSVSARVPGRETEPTSLPINTPELLNAPQTDNRYAGPLQRGEQWLADTTPGYREGSGVFGDYPQVAIDSELGGVEKAIRDVRMRNQGIENPGAVRIRGIDDLQSALDQVIGLASDTNTPLFRVEDGKRVTAQNPGIPEALTKLGLNRNSQDNLARALFQVEAGKRGGSNTARKEMFSEGVPLEVGRTVESGGTHESLGGGAPEIARLGKETVNVGTEVDPQRRQVSAQLQALTGVVGNPGEPLTDSELRDARSPFQGGTAEGGVPRAEFIKGRVRGMSPEQREAEFGPVNAEIANRVERRYLDAEAKRQKPQGMSETGAKFAARDAEAAVQSAARQRADADRAIMEIRGNAPRGQAQSQLATSAAVNQNTQSAPLEVRDGWTSGGGGPRITDSIRNQLSELNSAGSPQQGPRMSPTPRDRSMGERVAYATNKIKGYATSPRYQRGRRAGYFTGGAAAGIAGLDALIGGEQEKRQQEAMY